MFCFTKTKRLLKKSDFDRVFENANKTSNGEFTVLYRNNALHDPRLGLAIAKKVIPRAVDRNRIKRLLRESFRKETTLPCIDIIILAKRGVTELDNSVIMNNLSKIWNKLKML